MRERSVVRSKIILQHNILYCSTHHFVFSFSSCFFVSTQCLRLLPLRRLLNMTFCPHRAIDPQSSRVQHCYRRAMMIPQEQSGCLKKFRVHYKYIHRSRSTRSSSASSSSAPRATASWVSSSPSPPSPSSSSSSLSISWSSSCSPSTSSSWSPALVS